MKTTIPTIPPSLEKFAKASAALAESHGIRAFVMTVEVNYEDEKVFEPQASHSGEVKVLFRTKDGRGRPSKNLSIHYESRSRIDLISEPESF